MTIVPASVLSVVDHRVYVDDSPEKCSPFIPGRQGLEISSGFRAFRCIASQSYRSPTKADISSWKQVRTWKIIHHNEGPTRIYHMPPRATQFPIMRLKQSFTGKCTDLRCMTPLPMRLSSISRKYIVAQAEGSADEL